jgi:hypothetical protein
LKDKLGNDYPAELDSLGSKVLINISRIENNLYQTKLKSGQDMLNYPIRLNDKLSGIFDAVNQHTSPTAQSREAYQDLEVRIDRELNEFKTIQATEIKQFNELIHNKKIDFILLKKKD